MTNSNLQKILLVEDDPDIQTITKFTLEIVGKFKAHVCGEGSYALQAAKTYRPDLILLDVMMPDLDGPSVLKELRAHAETSQIPVIFMTAKVQPVEIAQFKQLGAMDVISKPFDPMTLPDLIRTIWTKSDG
jgi:two-component system, OmpR family, response regulator